MEKSYIVTLLFSIFSISCTQKEVKQYYPNGNIEVRYEVKNGIPHGKWREYYEDGTLSWEGTFIGDKKIDSSFSYYPNGIIEWKGFYDKEGENVSLLQYDTLGNLVMKQERTHPFWGYQEYYKNGQLIKWSDFIIKEKDGEIERTINREIFFDENGDTIFSKSRFIRFSMDKDTVELGDTIRVRLLLEPGEFRIPGAYMRVAIMEQEIDEEGQYGARHEPYVLNSEIDRYGIAYKFNTVERGRRLMYISTLQVRDSLDRQLIYYPQTFYFHRYYVK
jgi:hypothetical protein